MKKLSSRLLLIVFFSILFVRAYSQNEINTAKSYLTQNAVKQRLTDTDINEMLVSSAYLSPSTGWYHIYFNQTFQSVEVYNSMLNVTLQNGEVKYVTNTFVPFLAGILPNASLNRTVSPVDAIIKAADFKNLTSSKPAQIQALGSVTFTDGSISKASFQDKSLSDEPVNVKLYWLPYEEAVANGKSTNKVALTWKVNFLTKDGKNKWNIHVDANTGAILKEHDDIIHCDFGTPQHLETPHVCTGETITNNASKSVSLTPDSTYNVFNYPLENPNQGARTVVSRPYTIFAPYGTGPGVTNGWHNDGTTIFTTTRGNNVWAQEDVNANNGTGASPSSSTFDFNYPYSQTLASAPGNQNAAITNLFYWNNLIHDVLYKYGFDEPSGNFQNSNMGRGGLGNDYVFADAQDGSGTNNANFATPADGGNGRMQMYLFSNITTPAPGYQPDGDFDNGIIAHEYGHGWSNRLTGGPANSECLNNAEQAGEGWSDYALLMFTTNWASLSPNVASANISRTVGNYAFGSGIRPFPYSYDKANVNNTVTYAAVGNTSFSIPHGVGSIWATILWDMTWEIIFQDNQIVNNIYTVPANILDMRGNIAALKLVNEGLRLQPCSPSFIQSRDAILQADAMLFGGRYHCAIAKAFARRGLGANASTGISANDRTVTEDFTPISGPALSSSNVVTTCSNQVFNYTATTNATGASFSWTRPVVAGISNGAGSGSSANVSETLVNTTTEPITVKYLFTILPNDCPGSATAQAVNVIVNPNITPTVAAYTVCQNASVPSGQGLVGAAATSSVNSAIIPGNYYIRGRGDNTTTYTQGQYVFYKAITFVAPSSATVTFAISAAALTGADPSDTYLSLYQTSFNPNSPATNFLRGDDDSNSSVLQYSSKLTQSLTAGQTYILVVSTYAFFESGTFTLQATSATAADAIGFGVDQKWFTAASGGSAIFTGRVFNPVGVAGSGIPNTATTGSTTFYVSDPTYPTCRTPATFTIGSVGGSISSDAAFCSTTNSGTLTLSGYTGTILRWESSTDNFATNTPITNTSPTQTYSNVAQTTKYRAVVQNGTCASTNSSVATITVTTVTAGSNSPVTEGASINLTATTTGTSFIWAGPATFTSSAQNPTIASATVAMGGVYTVNVTSTAGTCVATATTNVVVNPAPTVCSPPTGATASSNSPVTEGSAINLTSSSTGGTSQVWAGPASFTSTAQNPTITSATTAMTGTYTVTITSSGTCTATATVSVVVNPAPTVCSPPTGATASSNSPVTVGATINLTSSSTGGTSQVWAGPASFTSTAQNPTIATATLAMAGTYTVTITSSGTCTATATVSVVVNPAPTVCSPPTNATASSNSPVTVGATINLTSSSTGGTSQVWAGPASFGSTAQNPNIASATTAMTGTYTVTITSSGTCTATATVSVVVVMPPTAAVVFVNIANAAAPTQDGNTWATAYGDLQTALSVAPANSEFWVAQGTYKTTNTLNRNISFNIPSGAKLFGGFLGTENAQSLRNFTTNPTILSGEIGSSSTVGDNSYHVVIMLNANNTTILDGFTITGGNANLTADRTRPLTSMVQPISINDGGGIALDNSSPMIMNCKIMSNDGVTGGGLFATNGSNPMVMNCVFMGNQATFGGGANHIASNPTYKNILFAGNKATGGAMYNNMSNPMISNVTIAGNGGYNGAVFNSSSSPVIKNSIIWGNILPFNDTQSIITYSIVEGGYSGVGNLNLDPQFVSPTPFGLSPTLSGDYKLTNTSPAIDAGDNGTISLTDKDLAGNLRRYNGGIVDMGAYEFQGSRIGGTVTSITSGNWEAGSTWNIGRKPLAGDMVIINTNHIVTVNQDGVLKNIEIRQNAKVLYSTAGVKLQTGF